jgi:hypothetical protein
MQPAVLLAAKAAAFRGLLPSLAVAGDAALSSCRSKRCCGTGALGSPADRSVVPETGSRAFSSAAVRIEKDTMGSLEVPADR